MAVSPGPWSRARGLMEVREAWAREQVKVSQLHTQVSLACPDAPVSSPQSTAGIGARVECQAEQEGGTSPQD